MKKMHLALSTLQAPLSVAGASGLDQDRYRGGDHDDQHVAIDWREHHLRPPPKG
jgi:hypothetical protein